MMTQASSIKARALVCALLASAAFVAAMAIATRAPAREVVSCDRFGCSDWTGQAPKAGKKRTAHVRRHRPAMIDSNGNRLGLVTVTTASGHSITIAASLEAKMQGFIGDLVARGYTPKRIKCYSLASSHVPGSLHFRGLACDFDQHGWGKTASTMYRVGDLTAKWGLRNGCSFRDCGHVDSGGALARAPWPRTLDFAASHKGKIQ